MREPQHIIWAGGEHPFLLRIGEMLALEKSCGTGIGAVFGRLSSSLTGLPQWHVVDITETLRLGLIGGGAGREEARDTVNSTADRAGLLVLAPTAMSVLLHSLKGDDGDDDEEDASEQKKKATRRGRSMPKPSTAPEQ